MLTSRHRNILTIVVASVAAAVLAIAALSTKPSASSSASPATEVGASSSTASPTIALGSAIDASTTSIASADATAPTDTDASDLVGSDASNQGCTISQRSLGGGSSGPDVICLQNALITAGYLTGAASGMYDYATSNAVKKLQTERDLFVDGIVGRESAISLGIWPDEASLVVHTPAPEPGAVDAMGYPMSTVSSTGAGAPPVPADSGHGRRIVYSRIGQRVWAIDENENIIRSWLVSGSKFNNETPGEHVVYSRSDVSTAWNGKAFLPKMVRWLKTDIGAIGFHAIPIHRSDNTPYQTEAELGTRLSGGCQRQANADADFMWDFAQIGTPVIVL